MFMPLPSVFLYETIKTTKQTKKLNKKEWSGMKWIETALLRHCLRRRREGGVEGVGLPLVLLVVLRHLRVREQRAV